MIGNSSRRAVVVRLRVWMAFLIAVAALMSGMPAGAVVRGVETREQVSPNETGEGGEQSPFLNYISEHPGGDGAEMVRPAQSLLVFLVTISAVLGFGAAALVHVFLAKRGGGAGKGRAGRGESDGILERMHRRAKRSGGKA